MRTETLNVDALVREISKLWLAVGLLSAGLMIAFGLMAAICLKLDL